jgi:hypothetical protein
MSAKRTSGGCRGASWQHGTVPLTSTTKLWLDRASERDRRCGCRDRLTGGQRGRACCRRRTPRRRVRGALLARRSVANAWSSGEIAPQSIDILKSERQPVPDERRNANHPRPRTITKNSKDGSYILPGTWRRQAGKRRFPEIAASVQTAHPVTHPPAYLLCLN